MSRIYASAVEHINNHPYLVMVSPLYNPTFPESYVSGELEPIYVNPTPQHPVRSMLAIKYMIDLHSTRQSFTIVEEKDIIRVFHSLDAYLIEVGESIHTNAAVRSYVDKVLRLRVDAYTNFVRTLNRHPEWKAAYMGGTEKLFALFELFAAPDFKSAQRWRDPIEQLRDPPVQLHSNTSDNTGVTRVNPGSPLAVPYTYA